MTILNQSECIPSPKCSYSTIRFVYHIDSSCHHQHCGFGSNYATATVHRLTRFSQFAYLILSLKTYFDFCGKSFQRKILICQNLFQIFSSVKNKIKNITFLVGSSVYGSRLISRGCGFESQHWMDIFT